MTFRRRTVPLSLALVVCWTLANKFTQLFVCQHKLWIVCDPSPLAQWMYRYQNLTNEMKIDLFATILDSLLSIAIGSAQKLYNAVFSKSPKGCEEATSQAAQWFLRWCDSLLHVLLAMEFDGFCKLLQHFHTWCMCYNNNVLTTCLSKLVEIKLQLLIW